LTGGEVNRVIETRDTERLKVRRRESDSEAGISEAA
jgi:hypothetical protein